MEKGIVVGIHAGSSLYIEFIEKEGKPINYIQLFGCHSPLLGTTDGKREDEYEAWTSFNYLRTLAIGRRCIVRDIKETKNTRNNFTFGTVPFSIGRVELIDYNNMDVGIAMISAGFAKVKSEIMNDYTRELFRYQDSAKENNRGVWGDTYFLRQLPVKFNPRNLIGKTYEGYIDGFSNGSSYHVFLLPNFESIHLSLAGVICPLITKDKVFPYANEALYLCKMNLFQRTLKIKIVSYVDTQNYFLGIISHKNCPDFGKILLEEGLASIHEPSLSYVPDPENYKMIEEKARKEEKNQWKKFVVPPEDTISFDGTVMNIRGSSIFEIILDDDTIKRVSLSGVRTPAYNPYDNTSSEPYGFESHEYLRNLLIGKRVKCIVDSSVTSGETPIYYVSMYLENTLCVNSRIIQNGYGKKNILRSQKIPSCIDSITEADKFARNEKKGIFSDDVVTPKRFVILSREPSREKSMPYYDSLYGREMSGIIEYFVSCTRLIVRIPEYDIILRMNLYGLKVSDSEDRIGFDALNYCNRHFKLRNCEVFIVKLDKVGSFCGSVTVKDGNHEYLLEAEILKRGFASLHVEAQRHPQRQVLVAAQQSAQRSEVGMWSDSSRTVFRLKKDTIYECKVVSVWDANTVVIAIMSDDFEKIRETIVNCRTRPKNPMRGDVVGAIFSDKIYRAKISDLNDIEAKVDFIDLCVDDTISVNNLRELPPEIAAIPPQGLSVRLAFIRPFENEDEDFKKEAEEFLWTAVDGQKLYCHLVVDDINEPDPDVLLTQHPEIRSTSVNAVMLRTGLCHYETCDFLEDDEILDEISEELDRIELTAKKEGVGAWTTKTAASYIPDEPDADYL